MALLKFQKGRTRTRDRQTAHVRRSDFRLARAGKVFEGAGGYVVVKMKERPIARKMGEGLVTASSV
jgi:hypothetical protein